MVLHPATPPPPPSSVPSKAPPNHIKLNVSPVLVTNVARQLDPTSLTGLDVQLFADAFNGQVRLEALVCDNIACGHAHLATQSTPQQCCVSTQCTLTGELFLCCGSFLFTWYFYFFLLCTCISFTPPMEIHGSVYSKTEVIADPSVSYP